MAIGLACSLKGYRSAEGGGLVDGVNDVDVGVGCEAVLHALAATLFVCTGCLEASDLVLATGSGGVGAAVSGAGHVLKHGNVDSHTGEEAVGAAVVDGDNAIVEDHELNMKLFHDLLDAHGYETLQTRDGIEALEIARLDREIARWLNVR